jgi:hypothetical protein
VHDLAMSHDTAPYTARNIGRASLSQTHKISDQCQGGAHGPQLHLILRRQAP